MACHSILCLLSFVIGMVFERYIDSEIEGKLIQYIVPSLSDGLTPTLRRNWATSTEFNSKQLETEVMCTDHHNTTTNNNGTGNPRMHWEQRYVNPMFIIDSSSFKFDWANKTK